MWYRLREEATFILIANGGCPKGSYEVVLSGEKKTFSICCDSSWILNWLLSFQ